MQDPNHPVWPTIRLVILAVAVLTLSYLNATNFDAGEVTTVVGVIAAASTAEGLIRYVRKLSRPSSSSTDTMTL
jgi:hypothetical protein